MSRITSLNMTTLDVLTTLAEGNPGAITVMMKMMAEGGEIDPDSSLGGMGAVLSLDTRGIYAHRIWMLYKDVCGSDIVTTLAALRAVQLGLSRASDLDAAIDGRPSAFNAAEALAAVRQRLPAFGAKGTLSGASR